MNDHLEDSEFILELKWAACNIIRENPGISMEDWIDKLIQHYPAEVVDAFGCDPEEAYRGLLRLWQCH